MATPIGLDHCITVYLTTDERGFCQHSAIDPDPAMNTTGNCFTSNLRAGAGKAGSDAVWSASPEF